MESQLPTFTFDLEVTAKSGRQDKLEIGLPWGKLSGTQDEIDGVRQSLGSPSRQDRGNVTSANLQGYGWIFNRPQQSTTARKKLLIRKRSCSLRDGDVLAAPLFAGGLAFSNYYKALWDSPTSSRLWLSLSLNPSRFARHQLPRFRLDGNAIIEQERLRFRRRELPGGFRGEFPLDESDNWIPDGQRYAHFYSPSVWPQFVRNYIAGTLECIAAEVNRACLARGVEWDETASQVMTLSYAETYWEFSAADPLKTVSLCESLLRKYTENLSRRRLFKTFAEGTVVHNSRSFAVEIRTGVHLVIYSKTNRRVRVEVRHRLTDNTKVVGGSSKAIGAEGLYRKLRMLQEDAAKIVNHAFQFMRGRSTYPKHSVSVGQLLFDTVRAVGRWECAGSLLSMLLENGKIVTDANLKPHVHALRDAGIITAQRRSRQRCYIVADRYARALEVLSTANKPLLDVRERRRVLKRNRASDSG